jgi:hypothetical protein
MTNEEQKEKRNARRRERYATDPEFRKKCLDSTVRWRDKMIEQDPTFRERTRNYTREYVRKHREKFRGVPTLFAEITKSREALAEKLVYWDVSWGAYRSTVIPDKYWERYKRDIAIAATVKVLSGRALLKGVAE